jgi:type II secretory pathway component PulK
MENYRHHFHARGRSGSALLLALWALLLLSAAVFAWVKFIDQEMMVAQENNFGLQARAYAYSGVQIALHPQVTRQTPLLEASFGEERGYKVRLSGEGGKLNINWLLATENQARLDILKRYLERRGLNFQEREVFVDCLLDWVDADDMHRINGVEKADRYQAANMPLQSVGQMREVWGSRPLVSQPGWEDDFTVYTQQGQIDLLYASSDILSILPGVGDARAQRFVEIRQGPDKLDGTKDDLVFPKGKEMATAMSYLGLGTAEQKQLAGMLGWNDTTAHIISTGQMGKVHRQIEVVVRKGNASQDNILSWKEH